MKYDKCSICNEKLKNGVCPMCGYDFKRLEIGQRFENTGNNPDYRIRPNEEPKSSMTKYHKRAHRQFHMERKRGKGKFIKFILSLVVISGILLDTVSDNDIGEIFEKVQIFVNDDGMKEHTKTMPNFTYEDAAYSLEKTEDSFSVKLSSGRYIVGLDLPEGNYTMTGAGDDLSFSAINDVQNISIYEQVTNKKTLEADRFCKVKNVRLYQGSLVEVSGKGYISCKTSDANLKKMGEPRGNSLSQEVEVSGVMTAGKDFPAGTYDVVAVNGEGEVNYTFEQDKDDEYGAHSVWLSKDPQGEDPDKYMNMELIEGTEIEVLSEGDLQVKLVPSKRIRPENVPVYDS